MTPEQFSQEFNKLKEIILEGYFTKGGEISRIEKLFEAGLSEQQIQVVRALLDEGLKDALYTVLLGLDGCACIGERQVDYKVTGESGEVVAGDGVVEEYAWEHFHASDT